MERRTRSRFPGVEAVLIQPTSIKAAQSGGHFIRVPSSIPPCHIRNPS